MTLKAWHTIALALAISATVQAQQVSPTAAYQDIFGPSQISNEDGYRGVASLQLRSSAVKEGIVEVDLATLAKEDLENLSQEESKADIHVSLASRNLALANAQVAAKQKVFDANQILEAEAQKDVGAVEQLILKNQSQLASLQVDPAVAQNAVQDKLEAIDQQMLLLQDLEKALADAELATQSAKEEWTQALKMQKEASTASEDAKGEAKLAKAAAKQAQKEYDAVMAVAEQTCLAKGLSWQDGACLKPKNYSLVLGLVFGILAAIGLSAIVYRYLNRKNDDNFQRAETKTSEWQSQP